MKKILFAVIALFLSSFIIVQADEPKKIDKAEQKAKFKEAVKTASNGDVTIANVTPKGDALNTILAYIDPNFDFELLDKNLSRSVGGENKLSVPIADILVAVNKTLARYNMNLQGVRFGGNSVRSKIDDGLPILLWYSADAPFDKFKTRTAERGNAKTIENWAKELRKQEIKKISKEGNLYSKSLVIGYNKKTNEYLTITSKGAFWLTEGELKLGTSQAYVLRF